MRAFVVAGLCAVAFLSGSSVLVAGEGGPRPEWPPPVWEPDPAEEVQADLQGMLLCLAREAEERGHIELLAAHFRSLELVVDAYGKTSPQIVKQIRKEFVSDWQDGPVSWEVYLNGRPLFLAWESPYDGVVSVTLVTLPKDWDPDRHYPLYFELHGGGMRTVGRLGETTMEFINRSKGIGLASHRRDGFHVYPFNRGLTGYADDGEVDLWECLAMVDRYLLTDPRRQYLYGFSLGGTGAFYFGASSMQQRGWAAVGSYSPTMGLNAWMAGVLRNTPVWLCFGEKEWNSRVPKLKELKKKSMRELLREVGNEPAFLLVPDTGHQYRGDYQVKMLDFLGSYVNDLPVMPRWRELTVHAFGDDELDLYVNNMPVRIGAETHAGSARVKQGRNVVAAHVRNNNWTGGFIFAAELDGNRRVKSDGTWKCTWQKPEGDWTSADYDDSAWASADEMCEVSSWPGYEKHPEEMKPFALPGVNMIGPSAEQHYRNAFQSAGGEGKVAIKGRGFRHRIWLNGRLVGHGSQYADSAADENGGGKRRGQTMLYPCETVEARNIVALQITSDQSRGRGVLMKAAVFHRGENGGLDRVRTGRGWRVSPVAEEGWTEAGFDDPGWTVTDWTFVNKASLANPPRQGFDMSPTPYCLCPGDLYFRKSFRISDSPDREQE